MKKFTLLFLALLSGSAMFGQTQNASSQQLNTRHTYSPLMQHMLRVEEPVVRSRQVEPVGTVSPLPKPYGINAVTVIPTGTASNAYTFYRAESNQMAVCDSLDIVTVIHRQDVTIWGGGSNASGIFRYDLSTLGGTAGSWTNDIGPLQTTYDRVGRYPQILVANPDNSQNPFDAYLVWSGATLDASPDWDGIVNGVCEVTTSAPVSTENYDEIGASTLIPAGLCAGLPGEYWNVDVAYVGGAATDNLHLYKGEWNTSTTDVDWALESTITPPWNLSYDGTSYFVTPVMAFSPDGMDGYISFVGDITGGHDSVFSPIIIPTHDGGVTWGSAIEVDLRNIAWIKDTLESYYYVIDSASGDTLPAGCGNPTTTFESDITVDANGNPHIMVIVGNGCTSGDPAPAYSIYSGINMMALDVWSSDGGATWDAVYLAPVLTLRGEWGGASGSAPIIMDNNLGNARSEDGSHVFFTWADSDTNSIGAVADNIAPNVRIASWRISDGFRTCYKLITDGDIIYDGAALYPNLAPTTSTRGSAHHMFVGFLEFQIPNDDLQPTNWLLLSENTWFDESEYMDPATFTDLSWNGPCVVVGVTNPTSTTSGVTLHQSFPNPTSGEATIAFELSQASNVKLDLVNVYGQQVAVLTDGQFSAGMHKVTVNTNNLAAGIYFYNMNTGTSVQTKKMIVTH